MAMTEAKIVEAPFLLEATPTCPLLHTPMLYALSISVSMMPAATAFW